MKLDELMALSNVTEWDDACLALISPQTRAIIPLIPKLLVLVGAANRESIQWDSEGNETLAALDAFNKALEEL